MLRFIKKSVLPFLFGIMMFQSAMADMMFYYSAAILPSIVGSQPANIQLTFGNGSTSVNVPDGTTGKLIATAVYHNGRTSIVTDKCSYEYDASIVSVKEDGTVKAIGVGNTQIVAKLSGKTSNIVNAIITDAALQTIKVEPGDASLPEGTTLQYAALGSFSDGSIKDISNDVSWGTSNAGIATINEKGLLKGEETSDGRTTNVFASFDGIYGLTDVTVTEPTLLSIEIIKDEMAPAQADETLIVGDTMKVKALGKFDNNRTLDITANVAWSKTGGIDVDQSGLVTAKSAGAASVTAGFGAVTDTMDISVENQALEYIVIFSDPDDASTVVGNRVYLDAWGRYNNGAVQHLNRDGVWKTSNSKVPVTKESESGKVYATATGADTATITVSYKGVSKAINVEFTEPKFDHLEIQEGYQADGNGPIITNTAVDIPIVDAVNYDPVSLGAYYPTTWAVYDNGKKIYVNTETFWWSTNQIKAYVNTIKGSFVFGRGLENNIDIKATWRDGEAQEKFQVNVYEDTTEKTLQEVGILNTFAEGWGCQQDDKVYNKPATVLVGAKGKYVMACGKFHYKDGTTKWEDINNNVAWLSTDRKVAFVRTTNGKLIAVSEGTTTISAQVAGKTGNMDLTVNPVSP
jgi:hypothetical protein